MEKFEKLMDRNFTPVEWKLGSFEVRSNRTKERVQVCLLSCVLIGWKIVCVKLLFYWVVTVCVTRNICLFQNKMNFFSYLSFILSFVNMLDLLQKKKRNKKNTYLIQLCTTGIIPYKCVIYTTWRGTNHSLILHNHVSYAVSSPVRQYASSISYATASHTKWMVTRPVWWDVRFIVALWTPFSSFIHSFNQISWVWSVRDVFLSLP